MPVAFKEWAVTVRALAEGEQLLTLRKGGIREENKHFEIEHDRFFLYPTFDHQRNDLRPRVAHAGARPRARGGRLARRRAARRRRSLQDGGIPQPDRVRIRAWAEVAASYLITDPRAIDALSPYYIWTTDYAEKRLAWKRRHPLHVIVLRTYRIPRPVTVKVRAGVPRLPLLDRALPRAPLRGHARALGRGVRARLGGRSRRSPPARCRSSRRHLIPCPGSSPTHSPSQPATTPPMRRRRRRCWPHSRCCATSWTASFRPSRPTLRWSSTRGPPHLGLSQPWLPLARRAAAPASRRYYAGWFGENEIHVLSPPALERRASNVAGSREALLLSPEHEYAHVVVGANNPDLPPPFSTAAFRRYVRWAWLCEGAAT